MKLKDQVAIVTGAGRNIGEDICKLFVEEGARVAVVDLDERRGAAVAADINRKNPGRALAAVCDVASPSAVDAMVDEVVKQFGGVDILVNNAGVYQAMPVAELTEEEFHREFNVNLLGPLLVIRESLMHFGPDGGSIINISSVAGKRAGPLGGSAYAASKFGMKGRKTKAIIRFRTHRHLASLPSQVTWPRCGPGKPERQGH